MPAIENLHMYLEYEYDEEYGIETDTCEACNKVVVVDHDDDTGYTIANCDACDAMCCRECLDKHSELRPACPKCVEITG